MDARLSLNDKEAVRFSVVSGFDFSLSASCLPSEFCPGVPWKGLQNIDPENDPNMTPGSVPSGPTINTNIHDVNRYLLRDRNGGMNRGKATKFILKPSVTRNLHHT